jgi:hypothetical protein
MYKRDEMTWWYYSVQWALRGEGSRIRVKGGFGGLRVKGGFGG